MTRQQRDEARREDAKHPRISMGPLSPIPDFHLPRVQCCGGSVAKLCAASPNQSTKQSEQSKIMFWGKEATHYYVKYKFT